MGSFHFKSLLVSGLAVLFIAGCTTPKKADNAAGAGATGGADSSAQTPVVSDKDIANDPLGSDGGKIPGLNTIFFEYDQARLTADARKKLADNAAWIKSHAGFTVQIEGHTDARGSVEYNLALGERRAKSVKSYLESIGVESKRMTVISYGKEKPIAEGDTEAAYSKNRRANFVPIQ
jgi:peptidoglycan-associated lipoprotein